MQLYWHTTAPSYNALTTIPENRVYVSPDRANAFIQGFIHFAQGKVISDNAHAPGIEIGQPENTYRRVYIESGFGKMEVIVTNGHLPWPFGREVTGYEVTDLNATLVKAKKAGITILVEPYISENRTSTIVKFPGDYIAEIHAVSSTNTHS
jgi:hypothetical protein